MRIPWDRYFLQIAELVARRSTCLRRQAGAILVRQRRILTTGYNGAPRGLPHCEEVGCLREGLGEGERLERCRGLHAVQNAILQAAQFGVMVEGSELFATHPPCVLCAKMLVNLAIRRVVVASGRVEGLARQILEASGARIEDGGAEK